MSGCGQDVLTVRRPCRRGWVAAWIAAACLTAGAGVAMADPPDYPIPIHRGNGLANVFAKLETGHTERGVQIECRETPTTLEEALAHNVTMCDTQCWTFEHNLRVLLERIGSKAMSGGWGEPEGPIGWSGPRAMDPEFEPRLLAIVQGLEACLAGEEAEGEARQVAEALGQRAAYREKEWLVGCLRNYLAHHARGTGY